MSTLLVIATAGSVAAVAHGFGLGWGPSRPRTRSASSTAVRSTVLRLRDEHRIDDIVLRQVQRRFDFEEVRLSRR